MYCLECGTRNPTDAQFCLDCGVSQNTSSVKGTLTLLTSSTWFRQVDVLLTNAPAAVKSGFERYFDFKGRSSRAEYWWWTLFVSLTVFGLMGLLAYFFSLGPSCPRCSYVELLQIQLILVSFIVLPGIFISGITVGIRRLHDLGKSGWWILLSAAILIGWIILIVWFVGRGDRGPNQYGQRVNQTDKRFESNNKLITIVFIAITLLFGFLDSVL